MPEAAHQHPTNPIENFSNRLLSWFDINGRKDLPWQSNKTAYRVWVSEIMLQQTQVAAVIGYYQRFMQRFPTLEELADASEEEVLHYWSGLGYYARGRNLLKAAKQIVAENQGEFPSCVERIQSLPGIGRSTAGAISSIALKQSQPILDGNVKRVLTRLHDIDGWPGKSTIENTLWTIAEQYTPNKRCDDYTQAIMDLGATICTRSKPLCSHCPFESTCLSRQNQTTHLRPTPKPKKEKPTRECWLLDLRNNDHRLLEKRPPSGIWGGLHSLPEISREFLFEELQAEIELQFQLNVIQLNTGTPIKHEFSHYKLIAHPVIANVAQTATNTISDNAARCWMTHQEQQQIGLPAPIKKYLAEQSKLP